MVDAAREEADEALARARELLPAILDGNANLRRPVPDPGLMERTVRQLADLEQALSERDPRRATLLARLGCLYGKRHALATEPVRSKEEGIRLLRAARAAHASAAPGQGLDESDRLLTAFVLATLLFHGLGPDLAGESPNLADIITWGAQQSRVHSGAPPDMLEMGRLLTEVAAADLPAPLGPWLKRLVPLLTQNTTAGPADYGNFSALAEAIEDLLATTAIKEGRFTQELLQPFLRLSQHLSPESFGNEAHDGPGAADRNEAGVLSALHMASPGSVDPGMLQEKLQALLNSDRLREQDTTEPATDAASDLMVGLMGQLQLGLFEGRRDVPGDIVEQLRQIAGTPGLSSDSKEALRASVASLPMLHSIQGGNLRDVEQVVRTLGALAPDAAPWSAATSSPPFDPVASRVLRFNAKQKLGQVSDEEITQEIEELRDLAQGLAPDDDRYPFIRLTQGMHLVELASRHRCAKHAREAREALDEVLSHPASSTLLAPLTQPLVPLVATLTAAVERDPSNLIAVVEQARASLAEGSVSVVFRSLTHAGIAQALHAAHHLTGERHHLDEMVEELEAARRTLTEASEALYGQLVLSSLAEGYAERAAEGDMPRAIEAGMASLRLIAEDVLMQQSPEHGLLAAQAGAERALKIAGWAVGAGDEPRAVAALEAGRAMVLRAAAASASVPERLTALGHGELAERWRRHAPDGAPSMAHDGTIEDMLAQLNNGMAIPGALRREALDALRSGERGDPLDVPGVAELRAGLARCGADALVYLMPGTAVMVGRAGEVDLVPLAGMGQEDGPLDAYLEAGTERASEARWEAALDELCAWAGRVAVGPVLERISTDGTPRLVLVPCGNLGVVPWHAARLPSGGFAIEHAVFSYAASGAQFLAAVARDRRAPAERPVLVADPLLDLMRAADEVTALRMAHYGRGRVYGAFLDDPPFPLRGAGTPHELLAELRDGASLLHVAAHGQAGPQPTVSALHLAAPVDGAGEADGEADLTVSQILTDSGEVPPDQAGPLVVLSACETDLSRRDHDEALTLTTAFVARGATDAVGSRWRARDSAAALLMTVFHHHLAADGMAPADALRAAQLWMLNPRREAPPGLSEVSVELAREVALPSLREIAAWGAFIHQGHPGENPTQIPKEAGDR